MAPERSGQGVTSFEIYWRGPISELSNVHCMGDTRLQRTNCNTLATLACTTTVLNF